MALPALVGHLLSVIIGNGTSGGHFSALGRVTLQLIVIFAVGAFFAFWRGYLFTLAGERVVARLRKALFSHMLNLGQFKELKCLYFEGNGCESLLGLEECVQLKSLFI